MKNIFFLMLLFCAFQVNAQKKSKHHFDVKHSGKYWDTANSGKPQLWEGTLKFEYDTVIITKGDTVAKTIRWEKKGLELIYIVHSEEQEKDSFIETWRYFDFNTRKEYPQWMHKYMRIDLKKLL